MQPTPYVIMDNEAARYKGTISPCVVLWNEQDGEAATKLLPVLQSTNLRGNNPTIFDYELRAIVATLTLFIVTSALTVLDRSYLKRARLDEDKRL